MSDLERMEQRVEKEREYWVMNGQWQAFTAEQEKRFTKWREVKNLIGESNSFLAVVSAWRVPPLLALCPSVVKCFQTLSCGFI